MSKKQRTPQEIEDEMNEQEQEQEEDREEDAEEEEEEEEEEESSDDPDKYAMLIEDESDLLCLGYSPEQLEKLMPHLLEKYQALMKQKEAELATVTKPETVAALMAAFERHVLPALTEVMRIMRQQLGCDHAKVKVVTAQFAVSILYYGMSGHTDILANPKWPAPENG